MTLVSNPSLDVELHVAGGATNTLGQWLTTFHLLAVIVDPYELPSAWIVPTASRVLHTFEGADCRGAWIVAGSEDDARVFLGDAVSKELVFTDPDRRAIHALGVERLPALVHVGADGVAEIAQGWDPETWRAVSDSLATAMSWSRPLIPADGDPAPFEGTPAGG